MKNSLAATLLHEGPLLLVALSIFAATLACFHLGYTLPAHWGKTPINWPLLSQKSHWITGTLADIKPQESNPARVTLRLENITGYQTGPLPERLNIGADLRRVTAKNLQPGQGVAAQVIVFPPEAPAYPGARDFRHFNIYRAAYGHGYVQGRLEPTTLDPHKPTAAGEIEAFRTQVSAAAALYAAGVPAALLVGDTKAVAPAMTDAYRAAGLSHLLAISGLQLSVAGLGIYWLVRRFLASWPRLALTHNIRLYAAVVGLAAVPVYALVAGAGVSVTRAAIMVGFFLTAVVAGRLGSSLRAWALALAGMCLLWPESALTAGFQLSFAATLALILGQAAGILAGHGFWGHLRQVAITSLLAGLATLPLVAFIFGQVSLVGLPANLLAVPLLGVAGTWLSMAILALWPTGLGGYVLPLLGWLAGAVNTIAAIFAALPQALLVVPQVFALPLGGLCLVALLLAYGRNWLWCLIFTPTVLGLAWAAAATLPQPRLVVLDGGKTALYRVSDKIYAPARQPDYAAPSRRWAARWGYALAETSSVPGICDDSGCAYATPQGRLSVLQGPPGADDCALSVLIIAGRGNSLCPEKTLVLGQFRWAYTGADKPPESE